MPSTLTRVGMALPGLLVQHSHARAAVEGLEKIYEIARDHDGTEQPLTPETLNGHFQLENAVFAYGNNPPALSIESLRKPPKCVHCMTVS